MDDLELIRTFRSHVEPADPQRTARARRTLAHEFRPAPTRPPRWSRFRPVLAGPVALGAVALAAAALLVGGMFGNGGTPVADAAILHRAGAALKPPPHMIFHTAVVGEGFAAETWQLTSAPYSTVGSKGPVGAPNAELSITGTKVQWWDPRTNTIHQDAAPTPGMPFDNPLTRVRSALRAGEARMLGTATIDGRATYKIQLGANGHFDSDNLVAYVDRKSYRPVALDDPQHNGSVIRLRVTAFEYLPATRANLKPLSLTARHPGARIVFDDSSSTSTITGDKG